MDDTECLVKLRELLRSPPDLVRHWNNPDTLQWLARAHALVASIDESEAFTIKLKQSALSLDLLANAAAAEILSAMHRGVIALETRVPKTDRIIFGPGAVYDFFVELTKRFQSAKKDLFVIDPYLDQPALDRFVVVAPTVSVRLLVKHNAPALGAALPLFISQHKVTVTAHKSNGIHDRVIFIDGKECWVLGQSIKDAATKSSTYLAPLSGDVVAEKLAYYDDLWQRGSPI